MKRVIFIFLLVILAGCAIAEGYESIDIINSQNWVNHFDDLLGYLYDSHGCLHFSPVDIYLLYKTIPPGLPLTIRKYKLKEDDPPFPIEKVPYLSDKTASPKDIEKHALTFKNYQTEIVVYPSLDLLFILVNGYPYAKVKTLAGPPYEYLMAFDIKKDGPVLWDFMLTTPTDPGEYSTLKATDHYLSSSYYKNTIVPFGAWIKKIDGAWSYQKRGKWYKLPDNVADDLLKPEDQRVYNYYDINFDASGKITAARYAGHDFGKYVLLWTADGKNHYPEMGYAVGELVFEQIMLVKDLVHLLTVPGEDSFDRVVAQNKNFTFYKSLYEFKNSKGKISLKNVDQALLSYYKLFNSFDLNDEDEKLMDERAVKAFREYTENRLPRGKQARLKALGLYNYIRANSQVIDKQAYWYEKIKNDWEMFADLRAKLREDFNHMGVLSLENRQNIVEGWLNDRLEFKKVSSPKQAKYLANLSFSIFFKPDEESALFSERERAVMDEQIRRAVKGEAQGFNLNIVDALNNYNFGLLLNEILGDLYKSHGCLHASPRNMIFLYELLPLNAQVKIYPYLKQISSEALSGIPYLADLVNFLDDLGKLKEKFAAPDDVKIAVYPYSGDWIIYIKDQPFARMTIRGGPQTKYYLVQGRDKSGKPIFEEHLAYPTTPGDYYIFKKAENYVSSIYHDQTIISMGGIIKRFDKKWIFQDKEGNWKDIPSAVALDLKQPAEQRKYSYYDMTKDASGEVAEMRWGSHPFGKYALQTTANYKSAWPELIHTSGDLIMEERQLINDLIRILTAPQDELDDCIKFSQNFDLYRVCYEFTKNPDRTDLIQAGERAAYRLYFNLPLTPEETAFLLSDVIIANKVLRRQQLNDDEIKVLVNEGIAYRRSGNLKINMEKILGLQFDTYQYVVTIQKYARHYATLKKHWGELSNLRRALLSDFNTFVIKDTQLFYNFMRELMLKRTELEKLTQENSLQIFNEMLEKKTQR